jgi:hypothetical protein
MLAMRTRLRELAAVHRRFGIGENLAPAVTATLIDGRGGALSVRGFT